MKRDTSLALVAAVIGIGLWAACAMGLMLCGCAGKAVSTREAAVARLKPGVNERALAVAQPALGTNIISWSPINQGMYLQTSSDLIHWTNDQVVDSRKGVATNIGPRVPAKYFRLALPYRP